MNIAIIGCGYVGTAIARHWRDNLGFNITATTTTKERVSSLKEVAQRVVVVKGNDATALKSVVAEQDIILLSVGARAANVYEETYLDTSKALVEVLPNTGVKQVIYTGSYSVYGDRNGAPVDEETEITPASPNAQILYNTEQVLLTANNQNLSVCILRLGGIYGPNRELEKIFSSWAGTTRPGDGEDITNWIHLDDIVAAIDFARQQKLQGIYNLVDDAHLKSKDLLNQVFEKHNLPQVQWDSALTRVRPYNTLVSNQKIKAAGYNLVHPQMLI